VFCVAYYGLDFGPMRKHERRAIEDGVLVDTSHGTVPGEADQDLPTRKDGRVSDLVLPVATLIGVTVIGALWIGFTRSTTVGLLTALATLAVAVFVLRTRFASETSRESEVGGTTG
jgi:tetracycline resistance efflux pump